MLEQLVQRIFLWLRPHRIVLPARIALPGEIGIGGDGFNME
jgi:hypothetical protein